MTNGTWRTRPDDEPNGIVALLVGAAALYLWGMSASEWARCASADT